MDPHVLSWQFEALPLNGSPRHGIHLIFCHRMWDSELWSRLGPGHDADLVYVGLHSGCLKSFEKEEANDENIE